MKKKQPLHDLIEPYLLGQLSPAEADQLREAIKKDPLLAREVELLRMQFEAAEALIAQNTRGQFQRWQNEETGRNPPESGSGTGSRPWLNIVIAVSGILLVTFLLSKNWSTPAAPANPILDTNLVRDSLIDAAPAIETKEINAPIPSSSIPEEEPAPETSPPAPADIPVAVKENISPPPETGPQLKSPRPHTVTTLSQDNIVEQVAFDTSDLSLFAGLYILPEFEKEPGSVSEKGDNTVVTNAAIDAFQNENYQGVILSLKSLANTDQLSPKALLVKGHAHYQLYEFEEAATSFRLAAASNSTALANEGEWYELLALATLKRTGSPDFRDRLAQVTENKNHPYRTHARILGNQLGIPVVIDYPLDSNLILDNCDDYVFMNSSRSKFLSIKLTIVIRGTYEYRIQLVKDEKGISATIFSIGGELFNLADEFIFLNENRDRNAFSIVALGGKERSDEGTFSLDQNGLNWLAKQKITTMYIKNNQKNQFLKFSVNPERQTEFTYLLNCFAKAVND